MRVIVVVACLTLTSCVYGMEWGNKHAVQSIKVYALTGLGGHKKTEQDAQYNYANMLFSHENTTVTIKSIGTPEEHCDLGQTHTMDYIASTIAADQANDAQENKKYDSTIILASSQGAAAILKLMSQKKLKMPNLKGIFFEGLFMSGNDAFYHSIHGERPEDYKPLKGLPYVRWWAPYLAQFLKLPHYKPEGDQPVHCLSELPKEQLPIAIIHGKKDQRVNHDDAMVLYTQLRQRGKNNVYLFSKEAGPDAIKSERDHVNVLDEKDLPAVRAILRKFNILPSIKGSAQEDKDLLSALQPKLSQKDINYYIKAYYQIHERHKVHVDIARGVEIAQDTAKIAAGAAAVYVVVKMLTRNRPQVAETAATMSMLHPELLMVLMGMAECLG
jgi:hypothetical protein